MLGKILSHDDFHEVTYSDAYNYYMTGYKADDLTFENYISEFPDDYFSDDINDDWNFKNFYTPDEFVAQTKRYLEIIIEENTLTYFFYETADYNGLLITPITPTHWPPICRTVISVITRDMSICTKSVTTFYAKHRKRTMCAFYQLNSTKQPYIKEQFKLLYVCHITKVDYAPS